MLEPTIGPSKVAHHEAHEAMHREIESSSIFKKASVKKDQHYQPFFLLVITGHVNVVVVIGAPNIYGETSEPVRLRRTTERDNTSAALNARGSCTADENLLYCSSRYVRHNIVPIRTQ